MGRDACVVFSDELLAQFYQFKEMVFMMKNLSKNCCITISPCI